MLASVQRLKFQLLSVFSDGEVLGTYLPCWCPRHPALVTGWLSSEKEAADGLCLVECAQMWLNVGLVQKGTCPPSFCTVHSLGWGVGRLGGARVLQTFPSSRCLG